ncbi:unnamed protein product [Rotaria sordida]|uniref:Uncharacterized protein n=1 Tax=Rotaria sordida TaxID=392033 RepID=A0A815ZDD3_9BILA|nr:unnamed protein product [Rotaria sordida]
MSFKQSRWYYPLKLTKRVTSFRHQLIIEEYQPKTLTRYNQERRQFLATFPMTTLNESSDHASLLLANVSGNQLSTIESTQRSSGIYLHPLNMSLESKKTISSYIHDRVEQLFGKISRLYQIDIAILNYNLSRLINIIQIFISNYRLYERSMVLFDHHFQLSHHDQYVRMLNEQELLILLEFFLQIDVDIFYMKVCTFHAIVNGDKVHHHHHHPNQTQLFSNEEIFYTKYDFNPCRCPHCILCSSIDKTSDTYSNLSNLVLFSNGDGHQYQFLNNYLAILNQSANCKTENIVYVLKCMCGEYEYIGSTRYTLHDVLQYHRQHINRLIIEHLLFSHPIHNLCTCSKTQVDKQRANQMRLYQHFARCPVALKLFLQYNSNYWCFVPMKIEESHFDDLSYQTMTTTTTTSLNTTTMSSTHQHQNNKSSLEHDKRIENFLFNVPQLPLGYTFSKRQKDEQYEFFRKMNLETYTSCSNLDYYHITIIAVLPDHTSSMVRQMIEILLATHAETKLNSINLLTHDMQQLYNLPYDTTRIWCENLQKNS